MRRPSAALIISCLALVGAWGGPAVADQLITSRDVKDRSLSGRDLRSNTITGRNVARLSGRDLLADSLDGTDIFEQSLGQVPRAREALRAESAGLADKATVADSVTGQRVERVHFARAANGEGQILDLGGLRLRARCNGSGAMTVFASTTGSPGWIRVSGAKQRSAEQTEAMLVRDDDFRAGDEFSVLPTAEDAAGELVYAGGDGAAVTVTFLAEHNVAAPRGYACLFAGTAVLATG